MKTISRDKHFQYSATLGKDLLPWEGPFRLMSFTDLTWQESSYSSVWPNFGGKLLFLGDKGFCAILLLVSFVWDCTKG